MEKLSPEQDHLCVRAHWHKVSLFHFTPRLLVTGNVCGVFVLVACFLGCVFVVWISFPGGIVDVFLNLASLDMTATVLSNADRGKKKVILLGTYLLRLSPAEEHLSVRGQWACKVSLFHLTVASQLLPFLLLVLSVWLWLGCFVTRGSRY